MAGRVAAAFFRFAAAEIDLDNSPTALRADRRRDGRAFIGARFAKGRRSGERYRGGGANHHFAPVPARQFEAFLSLRQIDINAVI